MKRIPAIIPKSRLVLGVFLVSVDPFSGLEYRVCAFPLMTVRVREYICVHPPLHARQSASVLQFEPIKTSCREHSQRSIHGAMQIVPS